MTASSRIPCRRGPEPTAPAPAMSPQRAALEDERRRLADQVAEGTWDLGGLVYEMAVRDHFRIDVLVRRAAELQRIDARLSEVERLADDHAGIAGNCRFCGAPHGRSAEFCWSCGERILVRGGLTIEGTARPAAEPAEAPTQVYERPTHVREIHDDDPFEDDGPARG